MSRRFQFSLRTLLGLAAAVCLVLGGWHLFDTYGNYIEIDRIRVGEPITVRGRYVRFFGPDKLEIFLGWGGSDYELYGWPRDVERSWLCLYSFECELDPVYEPGDVFVYMGRNVWEPVKRRTEKVYPSKH